MHFTRAVDRKGFLVGIYLGSPEHERIVLRAVDSVEECARSVMQNPLPSSFLPATMLT
jgi:hypothetical protein